MRREKSRAGRGSQARRAEGARALEELVRTVAALAGPAAAGLLQGLSDEQRSAALRLLAQVHRSGRADRHAELARLFAPGEPAAPLTSGIPGRLGTELRTRLAPGAGLASSGGSGPMARWARRLLLELGD